MKVLKTLTLCAALLFGAVAYAQNVKITGTVVDADSGEPIIGAAVIVRYQPWAALPMRAF